MYGITAYAQAPYAGLGGAAYAMSMAESFSLSDVETATAGFVGALSDGVTSWFNCGFTYKMMYTHKRFL